MIVLDRFEDDFAVLEYSGEDGCKIENVKRELVSADSREGEVLVFNGEQYSTDREATEQRRAELLKMLNEM